MNKEDIFLYKLHRKFRKAIDLYGLIKEGDKILIGLSGGKDSLALVELLGERQKIFQPRFSLLAIHITMKNIPYQADLNYLKKHTANFNIPFVHRETSFDISTDHRKSPCFLCSWNRRKVFFETAKEYNCNKIALGHHQDDMLQTMLMNLTFQGSFSTMPPLLKMKKFDLEIIRPMALIQEKELLELEKIRQFKKQAKNCPYEKESNRSDIKNIITQLEKINPHARSSMWGALTNIQKDYLPDKVK
jgi:tRNA(Ile)-lysidine synthase TilS/MesJ